MADHTGSPRDPTIRLGQLAGWATAGTALARLIREAETTADAEGRAALAAAIAASIAQLAPVSLDQIMDAVTALAPLLAGGGQDALVETLTVEQAALALGLLPVSVRRAVADGRLASERGDHGGIRIRPAAIRAYRERPRQAGGRPRKPTPDA